MLSWPVSAAGRLPRGTVCKPPPRTDMSPREHAACRASVLTFWHIKRARSCRSLVRMHAGSIAAHDLITCTDVCSRGEFRMEFGIE